MSLAPPELMKGGLVALDDTTGPVKRTIALQYNSDSLTRSYQVQGASAVASGGDRSEILRLKGWVGFMSRFPGGPKLLIGGIALVDPYTEAVPRIISLQYHRHTRSRPPQQTGFRARITSATLSV